jgi:hypothetical protein
MAGTSRGSSPKEWPGRDRSAKIGQDVLAVLACYRPRYASVAQLAGFGAHFTATGEFEVVEQIDGIGTDMFGLSGQHAYREAFAPRESTNTTRAASRSGRGRCSS